jgi:hypothetical protein
MPIRSKVTSRAVEAATKFVDGHDAELWQMDIQVLVLRSVRFLRFGAPLCALRQQIPFVTIEPLLSRARAPTRFRDFWRDSARHRGARGGEAATDSGHDSQFPATVA